MAQIWGKDGFADDGYASPGDGEALPAGAVLVPLKRFQAEREALLARNTPFGVAVQPGEKIDGLLPDLGKLALIALAFPKFSDGRAFSTARLLRERHGYGGELRATGDILFDRIAYMIRCGFDTFEIVNEPTLAALRAGRVPGTQQLYQPTGRDAAEADALKPWRRHA